MIKKGKNKKQPKSYGIVFGSSRDEPNPEYDVHIDLLCTSAFSIG